MTTLQEIADKANVSISAVSLALNNKKGVSDITRRKILEIAEDLGYSLRRSNHTIPIYNIQLIAVNKHKVLFENVSSQPFFNIIINNFFELSTRKNFNLTLSNIKFENLSDFIKQLYYDGSTDGIMILATDLKKNEIVDIYQYSDIPIVFIDSSYVDVEATQIGINNKLGARIAADYLIQNGHRVIGYGMANSRSHNVEERHEAFIKHLSKYNITIKPDHYLSLPTSSFEPKNDIIEKINDMKKIPTAFFCETDAIAIALIEGFRSMKIMVPDNISIIGFDNIREVRFSNPPLTTIATKHNDLTLTAIKKLIQIIEYGDSTSQSLILLNGEIIERESVKKLNT